MIEFAAAQAAQKSLVSGGCFVLRFAAAQAAQKVNNEYYFNLFRFAAAQAAQKNGMITNARIM